MKGQHVIFRVLVQCHISALHCKRTSPSSANLAGDHLARTLRFPASCGSAGVCAGQCELRRSMANFWWLSGDNDQERKPSNGCVYRHHRELALSPDRLSRDRQQICLHDHRRFELSVTKCRHDHREPHRRKFQGYEWNECAIHGCQIGAPGNSVLFVEIVPSSNGRGAERRARETDTMR